MPTESQNIDALIRHEALNVMTNLRFLAESDGFCDPKEKQNVLDAIAWTSLLIGQPEVFSGNSHYLLNETSLQDIVEIAILLQGSENQSKIRLGADEECFVMTDKNKSKDVLTALLRFLLSHSDGLELKVHNNTLLIQHHQGLLALPSKTPFECLNAAKLSNFDRVFYTLLYQAPEINLNVRSKENTVEVEFTLVTD